MDDFLIRAFAAGLGFAAIAGILGCFVVWRRMAYFSDSLSHSALLGIALGLQFGLPLTLTIFLVCLGFAVVLIWMQHQQTLAMDTLLGILAHSALAIGMIAISLSNTTIDLHGLLFGDILTVNNNDLWWLFIGGAVVLTALKIYWQPLLLSTISHDLAMAEGENTVWLRTLIIILMTITVAVSIRIMGVLLIASLLIIPAATARLLARSPEAMAIIAMALGALAVLIGLSFSLWIDVPSGPLIVGVAAAHFVMLLMGQSLLRCFK